MSAIYDFKANSLLGEEVPMRFTTYEKPGLFQRIFRGK